MHLRLDRRNGTGGLRARWADGHRDVSSDQLGEIISAVVGYDRDDLHSADERQAHLVALGRRLFTLIGLDQITAAVDGPASGGEPIVLAIEAASGIPDLPWELLHDGVDFLAVRQRPMVPIRVLPGDRDSTPPRHRELRVLFMACSPDETSYELDPDAEAGLIETTSTLHRLPLTFDIEPTGCLDDLRERHQAQSSGYYDVIHLTGHAQWDSTGRPVFVTETPFGSAFLADAEALTGALREANSRVLFLSGCHTARRSVAGQEASLAEQLVAQVAPAVIGWGHTVEDSGATQATAEIYLSLMAGHTLTYAMSRAYRLLHDSRHRHWHRLRLFARGGPPTALVEPADASRDVIEVGTAAAPTTRWGLTRVDPRGFVDRHAELKALWHSLNARHHRPSRGALLHGLGGIGKTTLASRCLALLPASTTFVCVNTELDRSTLMTAMRHDPHLANRLGTIRADHDLTELLTAVLAQTDQPVVFVFDQFERNEADKTGHTPPTEAAAATLGAVLEAVSRVDKPHRVLVTSRHPPLVPGIDALTDIPLTSLSQVHLRRKISRLDNGAYPLDDATVQIILEIAGENTRMVDELCSIAIADPTLRGDQLRLRLHGRRETYYQDDLVVGQLIGRQQPQDALLMQRISPLRLPVGVGVVARLLRDEQPGRPVPPEALADAADRAARLARLHLLDQATTGDQPVYWLPPVLEPRVRGGDPVSASSRAARALAAELGDFDNVLDPARLDLLALTELMRLAIHGQEETLVVRSALTLAGAAAWNSHFSAAADTCREAITATANALLHAELGNALQEKGEARDAQHHFHQSRSGLSALATKERARTLARLGFWRRLYDPQGADQDEDEALALARTCGDAWTEANCLRTIACSRAVTDPAGALANFAAAERIAARLVGGEQLVALIAMDRATFLYPALDRAVEARDDLLKLHDFYAGRGLIMHQAAVLQRLSATYLQLNELAAAAQAAQRAISMTQRVGWVRGEYDAVIQRAMVEARLASERAGHQQGRVNLAESLLKQAEEFADKVGWPQLQRNALLRWLDFYRVQGRIEEQRQLRERLDALQGDLAETVLERIDRLTVDAEMSVDAGDVSAAKTQSETVLGLIGGNPAPLYEARARWVLARMADDREAPPDECEQNLLRLEQLYTSLNGTRLPQVRVWLGRSQLRAERPDDARDHLLAAIGQIQQEGGDESLLARAHEILSTVPGAPATERLANLL
ncbi:hypothetical protein, partial [Micromonospora sp. NPDC051296]|uniref:hypothetical protein n=1 Tax=Micromonospora sp. NPDC051296 TaxID=3155046 RepID=UPI00342F9DD9